MSLHIDNVPGPKIGGGNPGQRPGREQPRLAPKPRK